MLRKKISLLAGLALLAGFTAALGASPANASDTYAVSEVGGMDGRIGATGAPDWNPGTGAGYTQLNTVPAPDWAYTVPSVTLTFGGWCFAGPGADVTVYEAGSSQEGIAVSVDGVDAAALGTPTTMTSSNGGNDFVWSFDVGNVPAFKTVTVRATGSYAEIDAGSCSYMPTQYAFAGGGIWPEFSDYTAKTGTGLTYVLDGSVGVGGTNGLGWLSVSYKANGPADCMLTPDGDSTTTAVDSSTDGYFTFNDGDSLPDSMYLQSWTMNCAGGVTFTDAYVLLIGNTVDPTLAPRGAVRLLPTLSGCPQGITTGTACTDADVLKWELGSHAIAWPMDRGNIVFTG